MKKITILLILGACGLGLYYYSLDAKKSQQNLENIVDDATGQVKMKKYRLNKLWRDNAASQLEMHDGAIIHRYILNDDEYRIQLGLKLKEEAAEVDAAQNRQELIEEMADVLEVLDCIIAFNDLDLSEIKAVQDKKRQARGSYRAREFVTIAQAVPGSFLHQYYLKSPDRHQEIID
jgi:predicted house-cleaning noncanonical NTP pyrophosphatase (MazG superfamily)